MRSWPRSFAAAYEDPGSGRSTTDRHSDARGGLENLVLEDQVVDWVLGQAKVEEKQTTFDAVM